MNVLAKQVITALEAAPDAPVLIANDLLDPADIQLVEIALVECPFNSNPEIKAFLGTPEETLSPYWILSYEDIEKDYVVLERKKAFIVFPKE